MPNKGESSQLSQQLESRISESGAALLSCCGCAEPVCQDGHVTAGDAGHITALFCKEPQKCSLTMSLQRWGSQNSDAVQSCWILETQLLQPQMNPEMVSPWENEWNSGRCTLLSLLVFYSSLFIHGL